MIFVFGDDPLCPVAMNEPSARATSPYQISAVPPKSDVTLPFVPNPESTAPFAVNPANMASSGTPL